MKYNALIRGVFQSRPNRFVAMVEVDGQLEKCHVKNTGRCKELLIPGAVVYLEEGKNPDRKTRYSLITVEKDGRMINIDSQAPNVAAAEWLADDPLGWGVSAVHREKTFAGSRFDFYLEISDRSELFSKPEKMIMNNSKGIFLETKGVTLDEEGIARFPDAPTERGIRHIHHLIQAKKEGYGAVILFVIQMKGIHLFEPNDRTQPEFREALRLAQAAGVEILAYDCQVDMDEMHIDQRIECRL